MQGNTAMADHHYTECGLQNVYISGISKMVDDDGDEVILIPGVNNLHRTIAEGIVSHTKGIDGSELRFLRSEMGLTQAELATLVHRDKQSIGRWERSETEIDSVAEAVIRKLAIEMIGLDVKLGMAELSKYSVPTAEVQPINIGIIDGGNYELRKKAA
jgi:transcriptional regulator with XRE-family HTH domain